MSQDQAAGTTRQSGASGSVTRRGVIKTAAWTAPAVALATSAPAFAASGTLLIDIEGIRTTTGGILDTALLTGNPLQASDYSSVFRDWNSFGGNTTGSVTRQAVFGSFAENLVGLHWNTASANYDIPALTVNRRVTIDRGIIPFTGGYNYTITVQETWTWIFSTVEAFVSNPSDQNLDTISTQILVPLASQIDLLTSNTYSYMMLDNTFTLGSASHVAGLTIPGLIDVQLAGQLMTFVHGGSLAPRTTTSSPHTPSLPLHYALTKTLVRNVPVGVPVIALSAAGLATSTNATIAAANLVLPEGLVDLSLFSGVSLAPWGIAYGEAEDGTPAGQATDVERLGYVDLFGS